MVTVPTVSARAGDRRRGRGLRETDDGRHRDLRRTGRDDERHGAADGDLRAGRRASELITEPAGTVALDAVVIVPTVRPAPVIAVVAAACVRPTTFGTATCGGPDETTRETALPTMTCVPADGRLS